MSARARPSGFPAPPPRIKMAAQLAPLKQCSPEGSIRDSGSAAHEGEKSLKK